MIDSSNREFGTPVVTQNCVNGQHSICSTWFSSGKCMLNNQHVCIFLKWMLLIPGMGNGERGTGNGEWESGN